jgi:DNA processing protein
MADPRLRLARTPGVGPVTFAQLIARFGTAAAALDALPDLARRGGGRPPAAPPEGAVAQEEARVAALGGRYLFLGEADYPALLAELDDAPPALIALGDVALASRSPCVAVVGARNASAAACRFARELSLDLARGGAVVVSGLARGIDAQAHAGALGAASQGGTVAVTGCGPDVVFPSENRALQAQVGTQALLLTEHPPGTEPLARHFPRRNRIIAGLSAGTVVVEAAPRSGSLITARLAGEQGREVMAVPGHPSDPRAQGCNGLIRDGAVLVQCAADVLEQVRPLDARAVRSPATRWNGPPPDEADDAARRDVLRLLGHVPVPVDELVRQSGHAPGSVQMVLVELELAGRLERHAGGRVSLP